jgi:hypothetical protein
MNFFDVLIGLHTLPIVLGSVACGLIVWAIWPAFPLVLYVEEWWLIFALSCCAAFHDRERRR